MSKTEQTKECGTNITDVTYANYESSFTRTFHIIANKIFSTTKDISSNTAVTCHAPFISLIC